jgi:endoglycosylceramidase
VAIAIACAPVAQGAPTTPLGHEGRWITDATGRVVLLHGVNMVYKPAPYAPDAGGFGQDDAEFLDANGFNTVRLGTIWVGVEPQPGVYDEAYLDRIAATESILASQGIFSLIDFHQDMYNPRFQGNGHPDWSVQDDGIPAEPKQGFPANYLGMPALQRAYDHFWANDPGPGGIGLQDRYAAAYQHVAARFGSAQHVFGYDLMNEPWPGSAYPTCTNPAGCPAFDSTTLTGFSNRVIAQIRAADQQHLVWYEPLLTFDFGAETWHGDTGDPQAGFSFHDYCLPGAFGGPTGASCEELEDLVFQNAEDQSSATGDALLLTEFGATDDLEAIRRIVEIADDHMVGWQYWHYCACDDPSTSGPGVQALVIDANQPPTGANVKAEKLDLLSRPYPQVVAGTPLTFGYDEQSGVFDLAYSTTGPGGEAFAAGPPSATAPQTEIFLPADDYPDGYDVEVDGGTITSTPGGETLRIAACQGAGQVGVEVASAEDGPESEDGCGAASAGPSAPSAGDAVTGKRKRCASLRAKLKRARSAERKQRIRRKLRKRGC